MLYQLSYAHHFGSTNSLGHIPFAVKWLRTFDTTHRAQLPVEWFLFNSIKLNMSLRLMLRHFVCRDPQTSDEGENFGIPWNTIPLTNLCELS